LIFLLLVVPEDISSVNSRLEFLLGMKLSFMLLFLRVYRRMLEFSKDSISFYELCLGPYVITKRLYSSDTFKLLFSALTPSFYCSMLCS